MMIIRNSPLQGLFIQMTPEEQTTIYYVLSIFAGLISSRFK